MWSGGEKSMEMPQKSDGSSVSAASPGEPEQIAQSKTKGPGDWGAVALQVTVIPKITIFSEPP